MMSSTSGPTASPTKLSRAAAALVLCVGVSTCWGGLFGTRAWQPRLLDEQQVEEALDLGQVSRLLCAPRAELEERQVQLSRLSTLAKLEAHLSSASSGASAVDRCALDQLPAVRQLRQLVDESADNVCSERKLELLEAFQREHLSGDALAHLLRLLYLHYAFTVGALCKRTLINQVEWDLEKQLFSSPSSDEQQAIDSLTRGIAANILAGSRQDSQVADFDDLVLVWDLLLGLAGEGGAKQEELLEDEQLANGLGTPTRAVLALAEPGPLQRLQVYCARRFRPAYSQVILPAVRLADLGFGGAGGEQLERETAELGRSEPVRRWYAICQACELILPVRLLRDAGLAAGQVRLLSAQEARQLLAAEPAAAELRPPADELASRLAELHFTPTTNSLANEDQLSSVRQVEAHRLVERFRLGVGGRQQAFRRALRRLMPLAKSYLLERAKAPWRLAGKLAEQVRAKLGSERELDEALLSLEGGARPRRRMLERDRGRSRPGDTEQVRGFRAKQLAYTHTMSWLDIYERMGRWIYEYAPTRKHLIITLILVVVFCIFAVAALGAASAG